MKIGWVLSGNKSVAGARIQGWNVHEELKKRGYSSEVLYAPNGFSKILELSKVEERKIIDARCDIVFIQKFYDNDELRKLVEKLQGNGSRIVYVCMDRLNEFLANRADRIVVVSEYLQKCLSSVNRKKTMMIFDGFEQNKDFCKKYGHLKKIKLVYLSNNVYDKFPKIEKLPNNVSLRIIGPPKRRVFQFNPESKLFSDTQFDFEYVDWSLKTVTEDILKCDVGILPYPDDLLNLPEVKRKSANRLIYMMSLGLPVIASPTDEFKKLIVNGENGFTAIKEKDWEKLIMMLRDNPDLRRSIGKNARKSVIDKYSLDKQVDEYEKLLKSLK